MPRGDNPNSRKNLEKGTKFTVETAAERGRNGAAKSHVVQRRNRSVNDTIRMIAKMPVHSGQLDDPEDLKSIEEIGARNLTVGETIGANMVIKAMKGDPKAAALVLALIAEDGGQDEEHARNAARAEAWANYWTSIAKPYQAFAGAVFSHSYTHYMETGGRGSTKSSNVSLNGIMLIQENPNIHGLVMRKVGNTIRDSVLAQYEWAIHTLGVDEYWSRKTNPPELVFKPTGQKILFRGADDPMKIKSIKVPFGYIGFTHFEELDQFAGREETRNILQSTMRGGETFWNFESFNPPISRNNWANQDADEERSDRVVLKTSYLDVPREWLGEQFFNEAEHLKSINERAYQHEYLGIPVGTGGNVFENLEIRDITDEEVSRFDRIYQGVDWGWYPDPDVLIRLHYDSNREIIYFIDEIYVNKTTNQQFAEMIKERGYTDVHVTCDSAEPKSVADLRACSIPAQEAVKGPGSVDYGMKWLQGRTIVIDKNRTPHAYDEFIHYEYERNKDGDIISGYPDANNHTIDATRYALERVFNKYRSVG